SLPNWSSGTRQNTLSLWRSFLTRLQKVLQLPILVALVHDLAADYGCLDPSIQLERVAGEDHDIGVFPGLDGSDEFLDSQDLSGALGNGGQGLIGRHSIFHSGGSLIPQIVGTQSGGKVRRSEQVARGAAGHLERDRHSGLTIDLRENNLL